MKTRQGIMMVAGCLLSTAALCASQDTDFARHAASGGLAEVSMGKLAESHAQNADVKSFGQRMVQDHSKANDQLMAAASQANIKLPANPLPMDQAAVDRLSKLQGAAFDRAYSQQMVKDHEKTIALFRREAKGGDNSNLKTFASNTLPTLKEHLKMAETLPGAAHSASAAGQ
jgi:putative membrane protein